MKPKVIKLKHDVGLWLQRTAELDRGRYVVEMRKDNGHDDGTLITAREARTLARALNKLADSVDEGNHP